MDWDTAATKDMTPCVVGMINKKEAKESVSIMMGNKQVEKSVTIGTYQVWCVTIRGTK